MAYDNFENTPFDLNRDGHIDSNEAAYIYDTFYNEDNKASSSYVETDTEDDEGSGDSGWYPSKEELNKHKAEMDAFSKRIEQENRTKALIPFIGVLFGSLLWAVNPLLGLVVVFLSIAIF